MFYFVCGCTISSARILLVMVLGHSSAEVKHVKPQEGKPLIVPKVCLQMSHIEQMELLLFVGGQRPCEVICGLTVKICKHDILRRKAWMGCKLCMQIPHSELIKPFVFVGGQKSCSQGFAQSLLPGGYVNKGCTTLSLHHLSLPVPPNVSILHTHIFKGNFLIQLLYSSTKYIFRQQCILMVNI